MAASENTSINLNLNLSPEEKRTFYQLFQAADRTGLGVITGEVAVPFFEKTSLPPDTLGLIWQIADKENRGLLTPSGFSVVLRLIGHAQAGRAPTEDLALQPGPLPRFEGIPDAPPPRVATGSPAPTGVGSSVRVPPLNPDDAVKFNTLFEKSGGHTGLMGGDIAKQIFERARLPNEVLGRIWNLADTRQRGQLDATEFIVAMHLLTSFRTGLMRGIPQTLPPGLFEAASRRGQRTSIVSRSSADVPPVPSIPTQFTGSQRTQSPLDRQYSIPPVSSQSTGSDWLISGPEKVQFDSVFSTVDTGKAGKLGGEQAVAFFRNAQLPEDTLAQIWDLADIDGDGALTRDEFAVAMYLVRQQRSRKEPLPSTLPPRLVPPSMRGKAPHLPQPFGSPVVTPAPAPAPAPVPVAAATQPPPRSAAEDLFGLEGFGSPTLAASAPPQNPQSTGGSNAVFYPPGSPASKVSPPGLPVTFKPFIPSSQFGQSLGPQHTGAAAPSPVRSPPSVADDLLGDNDPEESKKLTQETAELANLSNQIGSLAKEIQNTQTKRASAEQEFAQTSQQKRDFEARLAQARSMYDKEIRDFKALEERLNASQAETRKLQQELALIEGSREDLQNQYNQVTTALSNDQNENATLKERIRQANTDVNQLKPALEKARLDARQQKGLVAINKKQLATIEAERDRIQDEIETLAIEKSEAEAAAAAAAAASATFTPTNQDVVSPTASITSQNTNPFFRRTQSSLDKAASPGDAPQNTFDSIFGPTFTTSTSTNPPLTSFRTPSPAVQQMQDLSKSPSISGAPTPSVSPPPGPIPLNPLEPPPPPSRQITSSFLPFDDEPRGQSTTTSTVVSPPTSRFGTSNTPGSSTPVRAGSVAPAQTGGQVEHHTLSSEESGSVQNEAHPPFDEFSGLPASQQDQTENLIASSNSAMPGSFPANVAAEEVSKDPSAEQNFDEFFGSVARERSESQKYNDFDEAFAAMKPSNTSNTHLVNAPNGGGEFPPLTEFDSDDDSSDDDAPLGFDDNFTPASAPLADGHLKDDSIPSPQLPVFPPPAAETAVTTEPSANDDQAFPPKTEDKRSADDAGLLPGHADPTAAPVAAHSTGSTTDPIAQSQAQPKIGAPDFEAEFANLELAPAKEADDSSDEDDNDQHKTTSDFNFSFDSPQPPLKPPKETTGPAPSTAAADFFNFDSNVANTSSNPAHQTRQNSVQTPPKTDQDWDSIFAPLGGIKPPSAANGVATVAANSTAKDITAIPTDTSAGEIRQPGWALAPDTGEDDLILQRLTSMGYPRDESLAALEKFDYNLDKAADYLTSRS